MLATARVKQGMLTTVHVGAVVIPAVAPVAAGRQRRRGGPK